MTGFFENYVVLPFVIFKNFFFNTCSLHFCMLTKVLIWKHSGKEQFVMQHFFIAYFLLYYFILEHFQITILTRVQCGKRFGHFFQNIAVILHDLHSLYNFTF